MKYNNIQFLLALLVGITLPAMSEVYHIGPEQEIQSLKTIVDNLQAGDVVEIESGVYREVMKIRSKGTKEKPIVIRGVGDTKPVFDAKGLSVSGRGPVPRAIFQIEGEHIILENLEFKNARNGNNGAGIRLNSSTYATIRNCHIHHCDMGIQGGDKEKALIEYCNISFNSTQKHNGYSHNMYMTGNTVVMRHCFVHNALYGQNFKSRAHYNELWYNWITDSNEGEVGPVDGKGETDKPYSNTLMVGNVIVSKPNRTGNNAKYVLMGSELGGSHNGTLYMFFNIMIAGNPKVKFIQLDDPLTNAVVRYNVFYGSNQILVNHHDSKPVTGKRNWVPKEANVPEGFTGTIRGKTPGFVDRDKRDFRFTENPISPKGDYDLSYIDGEGKNKVLDINWETLGKTRTHHPLMDMPAVVEDWERFRKD